MRAVIKTLLAIAIASSISTGTASAVSITRSFARVIITYESSIPKDVTVEWISYTRIERIADADKYKTFRHAHLARWYSFPNCTGAVSGRGNSRRSRTGSANKPLKRGEILRGWTPPEFIGMCNEDDGFHSLGRGWIDGTTAESIAGMCDNPSCDIDF